MMHFIQGIDYECWVIVKNDPLSIITVENNGITAIKVEKDYTNDDFKKSEKNARAIALLQCGIIS